MTICVATRAVRGQRQRLLAGTPYFKCWVCTEIEKNMEAISQRWIFYWGIVIDARNKT